MATGPAVFQVEQAATFNAMLLMSVEPKRKFGSDEQELTRDRVPKWEAHLSAGFRAFGKTEWTILKVGLASEKDPGQDIAPGTPVQLVGFCVGVMDKVVKDKESGESRTVGAQVWYRADGIRSTAATGPVNGQRAKNGQAPAEAAA